jgi:hypothetical protein
MKMHTALNVELQVTEILHFHGDENIYDGFVFITEHVSKNATHQKDSFETHFDFQITRN